MGFLSNYNGTEKIDIGDGYWVEVKKYLARSETEVAEKVLSSATTIKTADGAERTMDTSAYRTYMVARSIVAWNLDDDDGTVWPFNNDAAIMRGVKDFPEPVFQQVFERVDTLNSKRSPQQQQQFRDRGDAGDPEGELGGRPAEPAEIRAGESDLAAAGPALG